MFFFFFFFFFGGGGGGGLKSIRHLCILSLRNKSRILFCYHIYIYIGNLMPSDNSSKVTERLDVLIKLCLLWINWSLKRNLKSLWNCAFAFFREYPKTPPDHLKLINIVYFVPTYDSSPWPGGKHYSKECYLCLYIDATSNLWPETRHYEEKESAWVHHTYTCCWQT